MRKRIPSGETSYERPTAESQQVLAASLLTPMIAKNTAIARRRPSRSARTALCSMDCRASAIAFVSSVGRFVGVAMVFILANRIRSYGRPGVSMAVTALAFVFGLLLLPLAEETKGKSLPA